MSPSRTALQLVTKPFEVVVLETPVDDTSGVERPLGYSETSSVGVSSTNASRGDYYQAKGDDDALSKHRLARFFAHFQNALPKDKPPSGR